MRTFRPPRFPDHPAPRQDGRPDHLGPPHGVRHQLRPIEPPNLGRGRSYRGPWLGERDPRYQGEVALHYGRAVAGRWKDGQGQWWEWRAT